MAKKDFNNLDTRQQNIQAITQSFLSKETLNKVKEKQSGNDLPQKKRKEYTKHFVIKNKENKSHTITMRLTDREYKSLLQQVEESGSGTISNYIMQLLERGL